MKKQLFIIIGALLLFFISGCRKTNCPAFPKSVANTYFPYTENCQLKFSNDNSDTSTFTINDYILSDSYSFGWNCKCACGAGASFRMKNNLSQVIMHGVIYCYDNEALLQIDTNAEYYYYYFVDGINPYSSDNVRMFGDTVRLTCADSTSVQLIVGKGVTRFFDIRQKCEWVLIED
jgi:hypothetical protein